MSKNKTSPAPLPVFEYRGQLVADSRDVANMIERAHKNLLRSISLYIQQFSRHKIEPADYFIPATYQDEQGKVRPCYYLTELGCDFVANKTTGEQANIFTAHYVKAFHQMRSLLLERASPIWQDTRSLGKEVRRMETDAIKKFVEYATAQGSRNAGRYYTSLSRLADRTAGITERDKAQVVQLTSLILIEKLIAQEITVGIEAGKHYKDIYQSIKDRLAAFNSAVGVNIATLVGGEE